MKTIKFVTLTILALVGIWAHGQTSITVADNSSSGTYHELISQLAEVCQDQVSIEEVNKDGGAKGNLDALFNNEVIAAIFHSDVLLGKINENDDYNRVKALAVLHQEPVHIVVLNTSKTKKAGAFSFGTVSFASLQDIGPDYAVGAAGGGVYTLKILKGLGQGQFQIHEFNSGAELQQALDNGQIAAEVFVGAAPLPNLKKLPQGVYHLIPVGSDIMNRVSGKYHTNVAISYTNLGSAQTIAPDAMLGTLEKHLPKLTAMQASLRGCLVSKLPELQETPGFSRAWSQVDTANHGRLGNWLDLGSTTAPTVRKVRR